MRVHPLRWVPAFIVGVCAATAAEIAVGLLLYSGPGLMRSLTTVVAVEAAAFGVGLWTSHGHGSGLLEPLRRRWLFCLMAFLAATLFSAFWSLVRATGGSALGQGLGLAFLGGLPLYAAGGVLGAMAAAGTGEPGLSGSDRIGAPAFLGAALGFGATGISLPQVLTPASLLLICLVLLSAGGLVYGSVLDSRLRIHVRARRLVPAGDLRVEDRHLLASDKAGRFLMEGEHVRRWLGLGNDAPVSWDLAALRGLGGCADGGCRILLVGGGASEVPAAAAREHPAATVDVVERASEVLELAREHMGVEHPGAAPAGVFVHVGNVEDLLEGLTGPYRLILVDTGAWAAVGGVRAMSRRVRDLLRALLDPEGTLVVGPSFPEGGPWVVPGDWLQVRYRRPMADGVDALDAHLPREEVLLASRPPTSRTFPDEMDGFVRDGAPGT
jgi:hypothetical protein